MLKSHKGYKVREFPVPLAEVSFKNICKESQKLATSRCPDAIKDVFLLKNPVPHELCNLSHKTENKGHRIREEKKELPKGGTTKKKKSRL